MAETYDNKRVVVSDSATELYVCPSNTTTVVIGCQIANVGAAAYDLDLWWTDASAANAVTYFVKELLVPDNAAVAPLKGRFILKAGDKIFAQADTASMLEATLAVLEVTSE